MERKTGWHILGGMERHTPWFQLVAAVLVMVGLLTLAAPAPAHAMDPQLILAMASAAGAIALIVGYLIVANGRDKQRAASLEGIYTCGDQEAAGPMGCAGPASGASAPPAAFVAAAAPASPMAATAESRIAPRPAALAAVEGCSAGQASGPMGCGGAVSLAPSYASAAPAAPSVQGQ